MAQFKILSKNKKPKLLNKFEGSQAVKDYCFFKKNPSSKFYLYNYYYNGNNNEPVVGDFVFYDILGNEPFNDKLPYVYYKEDDRYTYYLKIINSKIVEIKECKKNNFIEFSAIEQNFNNTCNDNSIYPDDLKENSEIFYHNGNASLPKKGDTIYLSYSQTLNNYFGLFNILKDTYYYFNTNNNGIIDSIVTCNKNISKKVESIKVSKTEIIEFPFNSNITCMNYFDLGTYDILNIFYSSYHEGLPELNSSLYTSSDLNPNNKLGPGVYYFNNNSVKNTSFYSFLVCNNEGNLSYYINCN